jgi:hypothetical protein
MTGLCNSRDGAARPLENELVQWYNRARFSRLFCKDEERKYEQRIAGRSLRWERSWSTDDRLSCSGPNAWMMQTLLEQVTVDF